MPVLPFALFTALAISMALTPVMIHLAPRLGMVDLPDPRKVHAVAVPRVGGIGIVVGAVVSILLWVPLQHWILAYVAGSAVLFAFGALDDSLELGHYVKFVGQFIAAGAVVYGGDLWYRSCLSSPTRWGRRSASRSRCSRWSAW